MKKFIRYLGISFCCFILLILILCYIFQLYVYFFKIEEDRCRRSNFSEDEIAISYDKKSEIIDIMKSYISDKYNLPLCLQWVNIEISDSGENKTRKFLGCSFNTYKKESNEYGHILVTINLVDDNTFSLYATFGDDENLESLKEDKRIWSNVDDLDIILKAATKKMKEESGNKRKYSYTLEIDKDIKLFNYADDVEYIYNAQRGSFYKKKKIKE